MRSAVIGLGEIGTETFMEISKKYPDVHGVDVDPKRVEDIKSKGFEAGYTIPMQKDVYIVSVYTPEQIRSVVDVISGAINPLIIIESTLQPGEGKRLQKKYPTTDIVLFPHRYNPNDPEHHVFNLHRIIGAYKEEALHRALNFYKGLIDPYKITIADPYIVEISKPMENAYRYIEIAIAEDMKRCCDKLGADFEELRKAMNTKWNIDVKEARNGIGGKCLPKDCKFINEFLGDNILFQAALYADEDYRKSLEAKGEKTEGYREVE